MTSNPSTPSTLKPPSLLDPDMLPPEPAPAASRRRTERWDARADRAIKGAIVDGVRWWWGRRWVRWPSLGGAVLLAGLLAFFALRPTPIPDYADDPMDEVLEFTLLQDDFNSLPIDERLKLLKELIERMKTMGSNDSVLMAQFAAMVEGNLREQMMKNASKLVLDVWDKFAIDYAKAPADQREAYLDQKYIEMVRMMEALAGQSSNKTDEELVADAKGQAKRDTEMFKRGDGPDVGALAMMTSFLRNGMGQHSSPAQQRRGQQFMRDMTRHFRGKDVETGKPEKK